MPADKGMIEGQEKRGNPVKYLCSRNTEQSLISTTLMIMLLSIPTIAIGQVRDLYSDSWVATDSLGRTLPGYAEVGPEQTGKYVGMFYFLWHGEHGTGLYDNTKIIAENPSNPQYGPEGAFHWWGEPEAGYYLATDPWVIRRNASMLVDAGVDVLFFDATNTFTYSAEYTALAQVYQQIRSEGGKTPQFAFLTKSASPDTIKRLYDHIYAQNLYSELWFQWEGKPLILGYPDEQLQDGSYLTQTVKDFFTFRESWAWDDGQDKWQWLDAYPQDYAWHDDPSTPEQIPVAVASHPTNNRGTSYHAGQQPAIDQYALSATTGGGQHFAEQWGQALSVDPEVVFVTGWNEWVAQRGLSGGTTQFLGETLPAGETYFVDAYNEEFNRDIEPMKDGHTDNYYYQLVSNVRKFKGVNAPQQAGSPRTMPIDGHFAEWNKVALEFRDTIADTEHRDWDGWGGLRYTNTTGRNDFVIAKVTNDGSNAYFYVETRENITSHADDNWMMLFIDSDLDSETGWNGYDYAVNMDVTDSATTTLKRTTDGENWATVGSLNYKVFGNKMEIKIPRSLIDQDGEMVSLNFHWADNMQTLNEIGEFFINGDSAPNRRFDYHYENVSEPTTMSLYMEEADDQTGVPEGYTTYEFYATTNTNLAAFAMVLSADTPGSIYQHVFGNGYVEPNPALIGAGYPELEFDTYVTIGAWPHPSPTSVIGGAVDIVEGSVLTFDDQNLNIAWATSDGSYQSGPGTFQVARITLANHATASYTVMGWQTDDGTETLEGTIRVNPDQLAMHMEEAADQTGVPAGYTTYEFYATTDTNLAVFEMILEASNPGSIYQHAFGNGYVEPNSALIDAGYPELEFDTYVTLGAWPYPSPTSVIGGAVDILGGSTLTFDDTTLNITWAISGGDQLSGPGTFLITRVTLANDSAASWTLRGQQMDFEAVLLTGDVLLHGDADGDGFAGADDLVVILTYWGQTGVTRQQGDVTGDGVVGADDYVEVLTYWGNGSPAPEPTPEPVTLSLLLIGVVPWLRRRRE